MNPWDVGRIRSLLFWLLVLVVLWEVWCWAAALSGGLVEATWFLAWPLRRAFAAWDKLTFRKRDN